MTDVISIKNIQVWWWTHTLCAMRGPAKLDQNLSYSFFIFFISRLHTHSPAQSSVFRPNYRSFFSDSHWIETRSYDVQVDTIFVTSGKFDVLLYLSIRFVSVTTDRCGRCGRFRKGFIIFTGRWNTDWLKRLSDSKWSFDIESIHLFWTLSNLSSKKDRSPQISLSHYNSRIIKHLHQIEANINICLIMFYQSTLTYYTWGVLLICVLRLRQKTACSSNL